MDEDDAVRIAYEVEEKVYNLNECLESDLCSPSTGQKVDILDALQKAMRVINEIHTRLSHEVMGDLREFLKENKCLID